MIPDDGQDKIYDDVVSTGRKIDILMSHDAPYGVSDVVMQKDCPWATGEHIGNKPLAGFIEKTQPKIVVKGHLHSTNREPEYLNESKVLSVSLLDENYRMVYEPQYFEI
jgi:Icc-related predicted phosphoesterase